VNLNHGTCIATPLGERCDEAATMTEPVRLCDEHKVQVAAAVVPVVLSGALAQVRALGMGDTHAVPPVDEHMIASAPSVEIPKSDRHGAVVYFASNGGRVKIGFTRGLGNRLRSLLLQGGQVLEAALHAKFGAHRIGDSEWFELAPEIVRFIASKSPQVRPSRPTSRNGQANPFAKSPKEPRRTREQLRAQVQSEVADLARLGREVRVKPIAEKLSSNRTTVRELLDEMNVRPIRREATG
jgi:hypothetical protein